jgi:hypothetical protein
MQAECGFPRRAHAQPEYIVSKRQSEADGTDMIATIRDGLPTGVELDEREEAILDLAARQARDVGRAEADIVARGYLVPGSKGQDVINPSIAEVRQSRIALGKLLAQLDLPDSTSETVRNARNAAAARWRRAS